MASIRPDVCAPASPIPILTYHQIDVAPPRGTAFRSLLVAPAAFARQMGLLKLLGYRGLSMGALLPYLKGELCGKVCGITFDDGYANNLQYALPVLMANGFSSTCYAVSQRLGQTNDWDHDSGVAVASLMNGEQLREWIAGGQEVGAHTLHHPHLPRLKQAQSAWEIAACKVELEDVTQTPVQHFCYPYGEIGPLHPGMVAQAGYSTATTTVRSRCQAGDVVWKLPRVPVLRTTTLPVLWLKLATEYEDRRKI